MSHLTISSKAVAYSDPTVTGNPLRKNFDWQRGYAIDVTNPKSMQSEVVAGDSYTFFNGSRTTAIDGTTAFDVTANPALANVYRFTRSAGTVPALRTARTPVLGGAPFATLSVVVQADASVTMQLTDGTWGDVVAGDTVFIPGASTGDAATPIDILNEGLWIVLAVLSSTVIQCGRATGETFSGTSSSVTLTSTSQVLAFSAAGVQLDDSVAISNAFAASTQKTFTVSQVTPSWFEVTSTTVIPLETGKLPTATGMIFYSSAKRFVRVECDQELVVRLNGATTDYLRTSPVDPADTEQVGWFEVFGPVWSLTVVNKSSQIATVDLFSAE
jgi:hypothetical protein